MDQYYQTIIQEAVNELDNDDNAESSVTMQDWEIEIWDL